MLATVLMLVASASLAQQLSFTVDLTKTGSKEAFVELSIHGLKPAKKPSYQMPVWAPGAYSVTNYGRFVKNFKVVDASGKEIAATKVNENRWEMPAGSKPAKITYSVINSYLDSTSLYFAMCHIDTNFFFANGTCLFGYVNDDKSLKATVGYLIPSGWSGYTANNTAELPKTLSLDAGNYDELADAPIMAGKGLQVREFEQGGAKYDVVVASDAPFPMDSLELYTKKIVNAQTDFFGDTPFKRYTFLINAPTFSKAPSQAFGALEHANSSAYLMINMPWSYFKEFGISTISHEFFHLWNVKRIHSSKLGPFDYTQRVMTTSLWLSEGVTDYYANALLSRSGILSPHAFEKKIAEWSMSSGGSRAVKEETLEQLSIDESAFDLGKAMSFYTKGPLVALMLDIEIRTRTNDQYSLDDVMHGLYAQSKNKNYFKDEDLIGRIEKITGLNLQSFYKSYIAGTDSLPLASYLVQLGLLKDVEHTEYSGFAWRTRFVHDDSALVIESFYDNSELDTAGLAIGDTILSINGQHMTRDDADEFSMNRNTPQRLDIVFRRHGTTLQRSVTMLHPRSSRTLKQDIAPDEHAGSLAREIRRSIYGG